MSIRGSKSVLVGTSGAGAKRPFIRKQHRGTDKRRAVVSVYLVDRCEGLHKGVQCPHEGKPIFFILAVYRCPDWLRLSMCRSVTGERVDQAAECSWSCGRRAANTRSLAALFKTGCRRSRPGGIARSNCRPDRGSSISAPRFQVLPAQDPRVRPCFADHYGQRRYPRSAG